MSLPLGWYVSNVGPIVIIIWHSCPNEPNGLAIAIAVLLNLKSTTAKLVQT